MRARKRQSRQSVFTFFNTTHNGVGDHTIGSASVRLSVWPQPPPACNPAPKSWRVRLAGNALESGHARVITRSLHKVG